MASYKGGENVAICLSVLSRHIWYGIKVCLEIDDRHCAMAWWWLRYLFSFLSMLFILVSFQHGLGGWGEIGNPIEDSAVKSVAMIVIK